jgi:NAD(P)H-dependent FMN reductase
MNITLILGTGRAGRQSEKVATAVRDQVSGMDEVSLTYIDVRDYAPQFTSPDWGEETEHAKVWKSIVEKSDGFVVVCPEYNHSFPGELKMLLDLTLAPYNHKPVAVCTVSTGLHGGMRANEHLHQVWRELGLVHTSSVFFGAVKDMFASDGSFKDPKYSERISRMIHLLLAYADALSMMRKKLVG